MPYPTDLSPRALEAFLFFGGNLGEAISLEWKLHGLILLIWGGSPVALPRVFLFFSSCLFGSVYYFIYLFFLYIILRCELLRVGFEE